MWYMTIEKTEFLKMLYDKIPDLNQVKVLKLQIYRNGDRVKLSLLLPFKIDNLPEKWQKLKYDAAIMDLDLFNILNFNVNSKTNEYIVDICIEKVNSDMIILKCMGGINMEILAEAGIIQEIRGCRACEMG